MSRPKVSLLFHSHRPYHEIVRLVSQALRLGFSSIWVNHTSKGDPIALLQALRRDFGASIRLGVAALAASKLSEDPYKVLSKVPSETTISIGIGDLRELPAGIGLNKLADKALKLAEVSKAMGFKTLLAAQGPRMLGLAAKFDGAMLSFLKPAPISYARKVVGEAELYGTAPSLVYLEGFSPTDYCELMVSARYVFEGASPTTRRLFPNIEDYYVFGRVESVSKLLEALGEMGLREAILAYPQTMNGRLIEQASGLANIY